MIGWNQSRLGRAVGVSFQQIQKYETGATRLSANRLLLFSEALRVPVAFLLQGTQQPASTPHNATAFNPQSQLAEHIQTFVAIDDPDVRAKVLELLHALVVICS
ncbi:helix-turn-helix domain-containing protein [Rhizobium rhizogenes]